MPDLKVLVTDAAQRKALAAVRALGRRGVRVCVAGERPTDQAFYSRHTRERVLYPPPAEGFGRFVRAFERIVARGRYDVVLPMSDHTTHALSAYRPRFERHTHLAVPDYATLTRVFDKGWVTDYAREMGVGVPETHVPRSPSEVAALAERIGYPCVIKPRKGAGAEGVRYAASPEDLVRQYGEGAGKSDGVMTPSRPLVQEYVPGPVHDAALLMDRGRLVAAHTIARLETYPAAGGSGVLEESTHEPELVDLALRLLAPLGWHGPAQAEFKLDERDGRPKLMEVNTRFWGCMDLTIHAGVDVPWLACRLALGQHIEPVTRYRVGLRFRWLQPYGLLSLLGRDGGERRALRSLLPRRGTLCDIRLSDPLPHLTRLLVLGRALKAGVPGDVPPTEQA